MQLADKIVYVGPFLKRTDRAASDSKFTNVYVKNLSEQVDDGALKKLAEEYGEVVSAVIMKVRSLCMVTDTLLCTVQAAHSVDPEISFSVGVFVSKMMQADWQVDACIPLQSMLFELLTGRKPALL